MTAYRYTGASAGHPPCEAYPGTGRFGEGAHLTLYVAETPEGAVAEFLRRHPELIAFQASLRIRVWELDLTVRGGLLDLRESTSQEKVGIAGSRLASSEDDEETRYAECRALARETLADGLVGIAYPSAAHASRNWNIAFLGPSNDDTWNCNQHREVVRPTVDQMDVRPV